MTIHYPNGQGPQRPAQSRPQPAVNFADRGMSLEAEINASNAYYLATNQAVIHKKPTPIQLVKVDYPKRSAAVVREAYFRRPSTTDYNGIYQGYYIDFDAKETKNVTSFPLKNFHQHQIDHLAACLKQGGICFALIKFTRLTAYYLLPASHLITAWQEQAQGGKHSIPLATLKQVGIPVQLGLHPRLQYLSAVDQLIARQKGVNHE
ncbi:Holliday junction resolvase RecU [Limosilactobacillus ingluviei]|uniref:Holliday junction resolvase RecU n=1 Tax=Limosilactobacillus ingluviei TaxID=148604 RepID=UPI00195B56F4|nr:Holliday junction resolvase RecU [Limosilactobacillus ingluviei]MBM6728268.1 Holliday junction resolvase RecU [Limosilactobacillus ingluviei]